MDRASIRQQERALLMPLLAEAQQRRGAAQVNPLELRAGNSQVAGDARDVFAGKVNKSLLLAAANAS